MAFLLNLKTPPIVSITPHKTITSYSSSSRTRRSNCTTITCKATSSNSIDDFDLYELLGIESSSDQSQIKTAYRKLQKRCHPDIAGPAGHDMAIVLNDVYSLLSDPASRSAYDKEQAKMGELRGYTGKPIYSTWFGSENEERAVFVDEVKCVGCLKCALFAENTFAIESVYGRARVVAQWADPEHKINQAIETCPVDCISMVERADLAALEYLMSKQPRGNVRVGASSTAGTRVSNIFVDVKKFQARFTDAKNKAAAQESDANWEARMAAIQSIRSITNWFYWQSPTSHSDQSLTRTAKPSTDPTIKKLRAAAEARKQATKTIHRVLPSVDEYWNPQTNALPSSIPVNSSEPPLNKNRKKTNKRSHEELKVETRRNPIAMGIPLVTAAIAAAIARIHVDQGMVGGLKNHVGGSFALNIVNSSWLQVISAGFIWYFIGVAIVEAIEVIGNRQD